LTEGAVVASKGILFSFLHPQSRLERTPKMKIGNKKRVTTIFFKNTKKSLRPYPAALLCGFFLIHLNAKKSKQLL
jgi:hypothetical protein